MSISYSEKMKMKNSLEVGQEEIVQAFKDYPGLAIQAALKEDCLSEVFTEMKRVVQRNKEMRSVIHHLLDLIDEENDYPEGEFEISQEDEGYKIMAKAIGDQKRVDQSEDREG